MTGEVDRLVTAPDQRTMGLHSGEACAHEEQRFAGLVAAFDGFCIDLGPQGGPCIVHQLCVDTVGERYIDRQIFAEISHPPGKAEIQHVLADDFFGKPVGGSRIGEIDDAAIELAEVHQRRFPFCIRCEITGLFGDREKRAVNAEIGVHVTQEADTLIGKLGDLLAQMRITGFVRLPVPEQACAKGCLAKPHPVLTPQARHERSGCADFLQPRKRIDAIL